MRSVVRGPVVVAVQAGFGGVGRVAVGGHLTECVTYGDIIPGDVGIYLLRVTPAFAGCTAHVFTRVFAASVVWRVF